MNCGLDYSVTLWLFLFFLIRKKRSVLGLQASYMSAEIRTLVLMIGEQVLINPKASPPFYIL